MTAKSISGVTLLGFVAGRLQARLGASDGPCVVAATAPPREGDGLTADVGFEGDVGAIAFRAAFWALQTHRPVGHKDAAFYAETTVIRAPHDSPSLVNHRRSRDPRRRTASLNRHSRNRQGVSP